LRLWVIVLGPSHFDRLQKGIIGALEIPTTSWTKNGFSIGNSISFSKDRPLFESGSPIFFPGTSQGFPILS